MGGNSLVTAATEFSGPTGRITRIYLLLNDDKFGGLSAHPAIT